MSRLGDHLQRSSDVPTWTVIVEVPPDFVMPDGLRPDELDGLLTCHVVRSRRGARLVSYWRSQGLAEANWRRFQQQAGITARALAGAVTDVRAARPSFWRRLKFGTWILSLAALFGALSALRDYLGAIIESPAPGLTNVASAPLHVEAGHDFETSVRVLSRHRSARMSVDTATVWLQPDDAHGLRTPLRVSLNGVPALAPGQAETITVSGTAPPADRTPGPDIYDVRGTFDVTAGLRGPVSVPLPTRRLVVWPSLSSTPPAALGACTAECVFSGKIHTGRPYPSGLMAELVLLDGQTRLSQVELVGASFSAEPADSGTELSKIRWRIGALEAFRTYEYQVYVETRHGQGMDARRWSTLNFQLDLQQVSQ